MKSVIVSLPKEISHVPNKGEIVWKTIPKYMCMKSYSYILPIGVYNGAELPNEMREMKSACGCYIDIDMGPCTQVVVSNEDNFLGKIRIYHNNENKNKTFTVQDKIKSLMVINTELIKFI